MRSLQAPLPDSRSNLYICDELLLGSQHVGDWKSRHSQIKLEMEAMLRIQVLPVAAHSHALEL